MSAPVVFNLESIAALVSLTLMEIVLGIDNIVFIALISGTLPAEQQNKARILGLAVAMGTRIVLLYSIVLIMSLTQPLFSILEHAVSARDIILSGGGIFLIWKAVREIHTKLEGSSFEEENSKASPSMVGVLIQIAILDVIFSLDSVMTAIGMANELWIMIMAIIIAVLFMMIFSRSVSQFIYEHPTIKMLALSFLLLIGVMLVAEGAGQEIHKGYIYSAMGFAIFVEMLNLRVRQHESRHLHLDEPYEQLEKRRTDASSKRAKSSSE